MAYMLRQRITSVGSLEAVPTWRYKLPSVGKYTAFELVVDCDRYLTRTLNTVCYPLETQITKIELVEGGSRALLSLTGSQIDALNYWTFGRPNARRYRQEGATGNQLHLFLAAGRSLYDREYGFDMDRLAETYLEYTHSMSADAADKFDVSDHTVMLYGWRWMGGGEPSFGKYLRARQLATWTTSAADTLKTIELPLGNPYRIIALQAKTRATTLGGTATKLELKVNNGEYSPVTITSPMHWCMQENSDYHLHNKIGGLDYLVASTEMDIPYWFSYYQYLLAENYGASGQPVINTHFITLPARLQATTAVAGEVSFESTGWGFQKCLRIGFDHEANGGDLFPTAGLGSFDLEITEAAASKEAAVFVQDVVSY